MFLCPFFDQHFLLGFFSLFPVGEWEKKKREEKRSLKLETKKEEGLSCSDVELVFPDDPFWQLLRGSSSRHISRRRRRRRQ